MMTGYRLVWFQHLHKAAGTYVIRRAMANGETFWPNHENGNPIENGEVLQLWNLDSNELNDFVDKCEKDGVTFVACEWGGPDYDALVNDERVVLLTCLRDPIKRLISNYNYDHYWMWTKAKSYSEYLAEENLHSTPEYYTRIFSRETDLSIAIEVKHHTQSLENLAKFDRVIIAENGMDTLNELGWKNESDTTHPTFGNKNRILHLLRKLRLKRCWNYIKQVKHIPTENLNINKLNRFDILLYEKMSE
jgi:hypothetical protein